MKKFILVIFVLALCLSANSQALTIEEGTTWYYDASMFGVGQGYLKLEYAQDTIINDTAVFQLNTSGVLYDSYMEMEWVYDVTDGPVYLHVDGNKVFRYLIELDQFSLLYDLDANVGDTIATIGYTGSPFCDTYGQSRVDSVGVKMINGEDLQYIYLSNVEGSEVDYRGYVFERIGAFLGFPIHQSICDVILEYHNIRCYEDATFSFQHPDHTEDCDFYVGIEELENQSLEIYPNPSEGEFNIQIPALRLRLGRCDVQVYNSIGELVYTESSSRVSDIITFNLSDFSNGIYVVRMNVDDVIFSARVVKE